MKRISAIILLLATMALATTHTDSTNTTTTYRERMKSSVSTAVLIGVAGTYTAGDTCVGTYKYSFQMHAFPVQKSGYYTLWEDVLGGTAYTRRSDWSSTIGKFVPGGDMNSVYSSSIERYISSVNSEPSAYIYDLNGYGWNGTKIKGMIDVNEPTTIYIPSNITITANRDTAHFGSVQHIIDISCTKDVYIYGGGTLYGKSDSSLYNLAQTEHDCGVGVKSSKNVHIEGLNILYPSGDGITVGYLQFPTYEEVAADSEAYYHKESDGIVIRDVTVMCPTIKHWNHPVTEQIGRNSISITGAKNVVIDGCYLSGGIPAVIDVEGNESVVDTCENLIITNCILDGLSKGSYTIGAIVNDSSFYLKSINGMDLNIASDSLSGMGFMSADFGNVASKFGGTVNDWQTISSNTATSGGSTTITVANAWAVVPDITHYAVIYNFSGTWPDLPDSTQIFGDGHVTASGTYTVTVTGITATLNQLAGYKLYLTTNPIGCVKRHVASNLASVGDSVRITLNRSINRLTPVYGKEAGLGDSFGSGISVGGYPRYRNIIISNNIIKNMFSYGIRIQQGGTDSTHNVTISDNRFENCFGKAIEVTNSRDVKIHGNYIYNSTLGINSLGAERHSIYNNTVRGCPIGGIWVLGSAGNDSMGTLHDIQVIDNHVIDCGRYTSPPVKSIWTDWVQDASIMGNVVVNNDTASAPYGSGIYASYCKNLYVGDNSVRGYSDRVFTSVGCTFRNTVFSYMKRKFGVNVQYPAYTFVVRDSMEQTGGGLAWGGGILYPESTNSHNQIKINGPTLIMQGGKVSVLAVLDTSKVQRDLVVASIDSVNNKKVELHGSVYLHDIVKANTHDAIAGEFWVNTSHDTMWYSIDGTNAAFVLINGYVAKH